MAAEKEAPASDADAVEQSQQTPGFGEQWRWLSWILVALVIGASLAVGVIDQSEQLSPAERSAAIARTIRCPQCRGQSVAESNVTVARQIRTDVSERVQQGQTDEQIQQAYVDIFKDESILLTPSGEGFSSLVWIVPVIAAALGAMALAFAFARWRRAFAADGAATHRDESSAADRALVEQARQEREP